VRNVLRILISQVRGDEGWVRRDATFGRGVRRAEVRPVAEVMWRLITRGRQAIGVVELTLVGRAAVQRQDLRLGGDDGAVRLEWSITIAVHR
jgi:hypothetical protein